MRPSWVLLGALAAGGCAGHLVNTVPSQAVAPGDSLLRPGDVLRITVWRQLEFSGDFVVNPDSTVAITGSVPKKTDNPAVPITVPEQIESTHAAYEAGAALVHVHVRNDDRPNRTRVEASGGALIASGGQSTRSVMRRAVR